MFKQLFKWMVGVMSVVAVLVGAGNAFAAPSVQNGSLEDLNGNFVNTVGNYMALSAGNTSIANWTVAPGTIGQIVWAKTMTIDGFSAADGGFFVDLSGFGSNSPNAALQQQLTTSPGQQYLFSFDVGTGNNGVASVMVGTQTLTLITGTPFSVGGTSWTPKTAMFTGDPLNSNPTLTIMNATPGANVVFLDNISVNAAPVPEPSPWLLFAIGLIGLFGYGLREKKLVAGRL